MEIVKGCPKFLKNGPCGGYKDSACEVYPDKKCIFVAAWERNPESLRRVVG
jgi:methylenetetrahydrofolate reductase (NADPH)